MDVITNTEITKVYEGPSGSGQYGPWQIFNFYVKDHKEKFSVFGKDEFVPVPGIKLKLLKYEIKHSEKDGKKYINYDVKEVILEDEQAKPQSASQPVQHIQRSPQRNDTLTMYVSYVKDMMVQLLATEHHEYAPLSIEELAKLVIDTGKMMYDIAQEVAKAPEKAQEPGNKAQPVSETPAEPARETPPIETYSDDVPLP